MPDFYSTPQQAVEVRPAEDIISLKAAIKNAVEEMARADKDKLGWARVIGRSIQKAERLMPDQASFVKWRRLLVSDRAAQDYLLVADNWPKVKECGSIRKAVKLIKATSQGGNQGRAPIRLPRRGEITEPVLSGDKQPVFDRAIELLENLQDDVNSCATQAANTKLKELRKLLKELKLLSQQKE